jgi:hypothetical protein
MVFIYLFICTQDLILARQVHYNLTHPATFFGLSIFQDSVSKLLGLALYCNPPGLWLLKSLGLQVWATSTWLKLIFEEGSHYVV